MLLGGETGQRRLLLTPAEELPEPRAERQQLSILVIDE